jgi:hypothetical protein
MEFSVCAQCGIEIEGKGINFRKQVFCSDECCDEFEEEFNANGEPDLEELDDESLEPGFEEDDLGYQDRDDEASEFMDDEFEIDPDDF